MVIIAEHKDPPPSTVERGLSLFTVHVRRSGFEPYRSRDVELTGPALSAAERSRPHYERLHAARVTL